MTRHGGHRPWCWAPAASPATSRPAAGFGNTATRLLFRLATGERIADTQTGLRGYPAAMLPWLRAVRGERYEYELNLLLEAKAGRLADRERGHRHHLPGPQLRVALPAAGGLGADLCPLLKFLAVLVCTAFLVDTVMFLILNAATDSLAACCGRRPGRQFRRQLPVNRRLVFRHGGRSLRRNGRPLLQPGARCCWPPTTGSSRPRSGCRCPRLPAKILTEIALLAVSYWCSSGSSSQQSAGKAARGNSR